MIKEITSKQNPFLKQVLKLHTKKGRLKQGEYILDGLRIVSHAIEQQCDISCLIVTEDCIDQIETLDYNGVIYKVSGSIMKMIVETETPQGIAAVLKISEPKLIPGKVLLLDQIQDPGNLGTLIRTADAAGFTSVMLRKGCTDPYSQKSLRSSMGSIVSIPVLVNQDLDEIISLKASHQIYGAALEGGTPYQQITYNNQSVLIIGNEGNGISKEVLDLVDQRVYIPMHGDVESLNAGIAGGILMFEMVK